MFSLALLVQHFILNPVLTVSYGLYCKWWLCTLCRSISGKKLCSSCTHPLGKGAAMIIESLGLYFHIHCFKVTLIFVCIWVCYVSDACIILREYLFCSSAAYVKGCLETQAPEQTSEFETAFLIVMNVT